ncbi:4-coumarate--CoA ligase 1 isoform X3 [Cryptotermes secundus]|nr:4-coumarate--CoA ligase 1 isoform X3 [Cryptotermes secundus]
MIRDGIDTSDFRFTGNAEDTAVLPYSSGTTGFPKGVMLSHRNIVSNIAQHNDSPEISTCEPALGSHQDVLPVIMPFFHIYGISIMLLSKLAQGVKFVTLPRFEPNSFFKLLEEHQATVLYSAPPLILFLASHPGVRPKYLQSLRRVVYAAAPLGSLDVERFLRRAPPNTDVLQGYGMTEASPSVSHTVIGSTNYDSVGVPVPNTEMKIVDAETRTDLPQGEMGEICLRGPQVMKGYLNRPDATAEMIDRDGWLHTGDLGYYDKEGHFYVVDRLKELIKVKGFQVAPAELEEILRSHPDIDDAAVIGVPDERAGEVPRAFVVPKRSQISEEDVKKYVAEKVSEYKQLKGGVKFLTSVPKSPSGKILRRLLKSQ